MRALLAVALGLALVAPSAADDACLTGASTLTDQRALASLRTATDGACPCASFSHRRDFQACARGVLDDALAGGALRAACRRVAIGIAKGAVCGTTRVACGRYGPSTKHPLSCRPRPAARCTDGARFQSAACTDEPYCADVVDWTAATCVDVRRDGPFVPGARVLTFTKPSAATYCTGGSGDCTTTPRGPGCLCSANADCASGVCETQTRTLATTVWYPAPAGSGPIDPASAGVLDAPLDPSAGPYPLLMFSHGSCGYPNQSRFLTALVASYGFVVVAPPHPGNTIFQFPTCSSAPAIAASFIERPQDILYALDGMLAENGTVGSPFFEAIDETRIGMSGHSFGGLTTYLTVPLDPRFTVALPMAPAVVGSPMLTVPSLTMIGEIDSYVNNDAVRTAYADATSPKYLVEIENAGHFAFSDGCFPSPDCSPPATLTQDEAHDAVRRYALPFLETYLAGKDGFLPFFAPPAGPGFVVDAQP